MWQSVVQEDLVSHWSHSYVTVCGTGSLMSHWSHSYVTVCSTGRLSVPLESKLCDSL